MLWGLAHHRDIGYGDQRAHEQAREASFDHYLVKPVSIDAVTEIVSRPRHP